MLLRTLVLVLLVWTGADQAQLAPTPSGDATAASDVPADPFGRESPRGAIRNFLDALADDDLARAARYLDVEDPTALRNLPVVRRLRSALDRAGDILPVAEISQAAEGARNDALTADLDRIGSVGTNGDRIDLLVRRIERDGVPIWVIDRSVIEGLPRILANTERRLIERLTPDALKGYRVFGAQANEWIAALAIAVVSLAAGYLVSYTLAWVVGFIWIKSGRLHGEERQRARFLTRARNPLGIVFAGLWFRGLLLAFGLSIVVRTAVLDIADVVFVLSIAWLFFVVIDTVARVVLARMTGRMAASANSVVSLVRKIAKVVIALLAGFIVLDMLGLDVTTGLTALGIGGLALALGAQKTVENLVGSVTVVADQPIRIGDFCQFGDVLGTVEDIGIRSTRIRTLARTLVTIPNGAFASMQIENYTARDRMLFRHFLSCRYETSAAKVRTLTERLQRMLDEHPMTEKGPGCRATFTALGSDNLTVELFAYFLTDDYLGFLKEQQRFLLEIMEAFEDEGVEFAFPSQTVYLADDTVSPIMRGQAAAQP